MQRPLMISIIIVLTFGFCHSTSPQKNITAGQILKDSILRIEMHLSAFGVESDNFPSIEAYIDFVRDSSNCKKSYYNPAFKDSSYYLSDDEIKRILALLQNADLEKFKNEYRIAATDQPTSTTIIYTGEKKYIIKDYGLEGEYPLQELYKIVYKL